MSAVSPQAVTLSFRLGGADGVAVEARKWAAALADLGYATRRIAGAIEDGGAPDDVVLPGLAIGAPAAPSIAELAEALDGADLVIVDNLCSLPLNPDAADAVARATEAHGGRICFRHHDLPWQRRHLAHLEDRFPPRIDSALHATINLRSRRELEARGYERAVTVHNYFDLDPALGDRAATRRALGFADDDLVCFHPARAIERKNVPGGLRFASRLATLVGDRPVRYWLSGPAEDGYGPTLDRLLAATDVPVTMGRVTVADGYAASDLVVFPSTWEGFGNPIIESIAHRRPCAAAPYPVLAEILATGIRTLSTEHPEQVARFLARSPAEQEHALAVNRRRAGFSFDIAELPAAIDAAFRRVGWTTW